MAAEDRRVRAELAADGSLFDGYHPRMAQVHRRNAARHEASLDGHGWPAAALVVEDPGRVDELRRNVGLGRLDEVEYRSEGVVAESWIARRT
jgi:hypothetical protein